MEESNEFMEFVKRNIQSPDFSKFLCMNPRLLTFLMVRAIETSMIFSIYTTKVKSFKRWKLKMERGKFIFLVVMVVAILHLFYPKKNPYFYWHLIRDKTLENRSCCVE